MMISDFSYPPDVNADGDSVFFQDTVLEKIIGCGLSENFYGLSKEIN
jgi:hypothetical protein